MAVAFELIEVTIVFAVSGAIKDISSLAAGFFGPFCSCLVAYDCVHCRNPILVFDSKSD